MIFIQGPPPNGSKDTNIPCNPWSKKGPGPQEQDQRAPDSRLRGERNADDALYPDLTPTQKQKQRKTKTRTQSQKVKKVKASEKLVIDTTTLILSITSTRAHIRDNGANYQKKSLLRKRKSTPRYSFPSFFIFHLPYIFLKYACP